MKTIFFTLLVTGVTCQGQLTPENLGLAIDDGPFTGSADVSSFFGLNAGTLRFDYAGINTLSETSFNTDIATGNYQLILDSSIVQAGGGVVVDFDAVVRHGANLSNGATDGFTAFDGNAWSFTGSSTFTDSSSGNDFQLTNNTGTSGDTGSITWRANDVTDVNVTGFSLGSGSSNNFFLDLSDFTLQSVPEPSSVALLGFGALALTVRRKRA